MNSPLESMPPIIGLFSHGPGHGKTTVARMIRDLMPRVSILSFATALREEVALTMRKKGITDAQIQHYLNADKGAPIDAFGGKSGRDLMIEHGQGKRRIKPLYWVEEFAKRAERIRAAGHRVVCDDVRFRNERDLIHSMGGVMWQIRNPDVYVDHYALAESETERELLNYEGDLTITNSPHIDTRATLHYLLLGDGSMEVAGASPR